MAVDFFVSWALWEKMTFVLVCLIVLTFGAGFIRLWWLNRIAKKHERLDEEKRARTEELRNSGLVGNPDIEQNIPFGVRAIESGIEIDGIWVSRPNTPASETRTLLRGSDRSADSSAISSTTDPSQQSIPPSLKPQPAFVQHQYAVEGQTPLEIRVSLDATESKQRPTYKPRRSSQLRFSSSGEVESDEESPEKGKNTLRAAPQVSPGDKEQSRRLLAPPSINANNSDDLPADDIDQLSGSSSNSTRTYLSRGRQTKDGSGRYQPVSAYSIGDTTSYEDVDASTFSSSLKIEHADPFYTVPIDDDSPRKSTSFRSQILSSVQNSSVVTHGDNSSSAESQLPLLAQKESSAPVTPTFGPGDLHMNTVARKVNSGFEVLPAGTFGPHPDLMTSGLGDTEVVKGSDRKGAPTSSERFSTSTGRRSPRKLQKKERKSFFSRP